MTRITECRQCQHAERAMRYQSKKLAFRYCTVALNKTGIPRGLEPICPPKGTPDWCPLEALQGEPEGRRSEGGLR